MELKKVLLGMVLGVVVSYSYFWISGQVSWWEPANQIKTVEVGY